VDDSVIVLGLVTTKKPALEAKSGLKRRIREAEKYVPLERLALSPQCGFASTESGNLLAAADQPRSCASSRRRPKKCGLPSRSTEAHEIRLGLAEGADDYAPRRFETSRDGLGVASAEPELRLVWESALDHSHLAHGG
jgi:hypothetical protein